MYWKLIEDNPSSALTNMQKDALLLQQLSFNPEPILHLYDWNGDSATYGHFINPSDFLNLDQASKLGLELAKRPTGGGIIFHISDLAFSVLLPACHPDFSDNTLENYAFVNKKVIQAIQNYLNFSFDMELLPTEPLAKDNHCKAFCMAKPTKYDVMLNGKKIGGAAQRKTKSGFLHQGSISIARISEEYLEKILLPNTLVMDQMKRSSASLIEGDWNRHQLINARTKLRQCLKESFLSSL